MLTRDYLLRMIDQLVRVIAKVLAHAEAGEFQQAINELGTAARHHVGLSLENLTSLSESSLAALWRAGGSFDAAKCAAAAYLLKSYGETRRLQKDEASNDVTPVVVRALDFFMLSVVEGEGEIQRELAQEAEDLLGSLHDLELPPSTRLLLFRFRERLGAYAKAEDVLFELLEEDPSMNREAKAFYNRLLSRSDDDLVRGNLPRSEIIDALRKLEAHPETTRKESQP